jgi:hypothetical protein
MAWNDERLYRPEAKVDGAVLGCALGKIPRIPLGMTTKNESVISNPSAVLRIKLSERSFPNYRSEDYLDSSMLRGILRSN